MIMNILIAIIFFILGIQFAVLGVKKLIKDGKLIANKEVEND